MVNIREFYEQNGDVLPGKKVSSEHASVSPHDDVYCRKTRCTC